MPSAHSTPVIESDTVVHLDNANCRITSDRLSELRCVTRGKKGTVALFIAGTLFIYVSIGIFVWILPSGRLELTFLNSGALLFAFGVFLQWRSVIRYRELGTYVIDREQKRIRLGSSARGWSFEDVSRIRLSLDVLGGARLTGRPRLLYWLVLRFGDGKRIRIAQGERRELQPVIDWLAAAGISIQ